MDDGRVPTDYACLVEKTAKESADFVILHNDAVAQVENKPR
jgi:hypothetical protein